jgi:hypothetical protein
MILHEETGEFQLASNRTKLRVRWAYSPSDGFKTHAGVSL